MSQQPHEIIWTLTNAVIASRSLHVVAELGVADQIADQPVDVTELASRCGADPDALDRVLRLLVAHGVFACRAGGYRHTEASRLLRSDDPMSMRALARLNGLRVFADAYTDLEHSVRTGSPAVELTVPKGMWAYLEDHPDQAQLFGQAMTARAGADIAAVLGGYEFGRFRTIADIGGGHGHLLRAVLDAVPTAVGVLFDLPAVVDVADLDHERLRPQPGDFFVDPLPAADAYLLMEVIHDWADAEAVAILSAIRRAASPGATVLIIEGVVGELPDPRVQTLDVVMLAVTGGRERSPSQLATLLDTAGFRLGRVVETSGPLSIVEATAMGGDRHG